MEYVVIMALVAVVGVLLLWLPKRRERHPFKTMDDFEASLRKLAPEPGKTEADPNPKA